MIAISRYLYWSVGNYFLSIPVVLVFLPFSYSIFIVMALLAIFFFQFLVHKRYCNKDCLNFIQGELSYWQLCKFGKSHESLQLVESICLFQKVFFLSFKSKSCSRKFSVMVFFRAREADSLYNLQKIVFNGGGS